MKRTILNHLKKREKVNDYSTGFTLLELVVTIAIFAVLLAVTVPNFESWVYGSKSNRAVTRVIATIHDARLKGVKGDRGARVDFNQVNNQITVVWNENGVDRTEIHQLSDDPARVTFDATPPGTTPAPDATFFFDNLGFLNPPGGGSTSSIYIVDNRNLRRFHIAATVAGGVVERQWNGTTWIGPTITDTSAAPVVP